ncbi:DDE-type integrase/transposase/recombinase [Aliihoeflea aestuarii]|jgi:putative transposase|uniref:Mu transposase C-terminal domain-containing protein n=1 Tax=Aliihoeflea aestuarii TaxID=453840 RepID=UPI0020947CB2|nr:Mu transposase C-terminal domain-containing protein [Aliihoeflea aestuarii]MCO6393255.1 DDE-type integrase/transposase/recombinase [Aliihoeflea aestuarii]
MNAPCETLPIRLEPQDKVTISGIDYVPDSFDDDGHTLRRLDMPDAYHQFSHDELRSIWNEHVQLHPRFFSRSSGKRRASGYTLQTLPRDELPKIYWRKDWCDAFLEEERAGKVSRSDQAIREFVAENELRIMGLASRAEARSGRCDRLRKSYGPPSPTCLREWLRKYEAADFDPIVFRDRYGRSGNRTDRLHEQVRALLVQAAESYADSRRPSKEQIMRQLHEQMNDLNTRRSEEGEPTLAVPSMSTLSREITKLNVYQTVAVREGFAKARNKFSPVRHEHSIRRPLERVEMDEWLVSLQTLLQKAELWSKLSPKQKAEAKKTRVWLSVMIDCATRSIVAAHLIKGSPTSEDALATMRMAVSDKSAIAAAAGCRSPWLAGGRFEAMATDTGAAYYAHETRAACGDLGADQIFPPAGVPQMRGRIERVFSTLHKQFVSLFHGRTFENVAAKGDYDAEAMAIMDADELYLLLIRYIVDIYHNQPHDGLGGETPNECWNRLGKRHFIRPHADANTIGSVFGVTLERTLRREGIEVFGIFYSHDDLHRARREKNTAKVKIRVDQTDLSRIWVHLDDKWLTVNAVRDDLKRVALDTWLKNRAEDMKEFAAQAEMAKPVVDAAYRDIRQFVMSAEQRAGLFPLTYSNARLVGLADSISKFARTDDALSECDMLEAYDEEETNPVTDLPATENSIISGPSVGQSNTDDSDDFLED